MMNEPAILWKGIQLCIAIQLVLVGIIHVCSKTQTKVILGLVCLIVSTYFFKTIFWQLIDNNTLFTFFLSGALFCFYGQLLYAYVVAIEKKLSLKFIIRHFSLPLIIALLYAISRTFYYNFFSANGLLINIVLLVVCLLWIGVYFYLGIQKFKSTLNNALVIKAKRKYKFFYYAINIFLLNQFTSALLVVIAHKTENAFILAIDTYYMSFFSEYLNMPLYAILSTYLLLYALSQSKSFKSFFLSDQQHLNKELVEGKAIISKRIQTHFYKDKIFINPDLKLKAAADKIGVSEKILSEYLLNEYGMNFKDFINTLRVNEFKALLQMSRSKNYSLLGLAEDSGFKSKATFYRVFKNKEGMTPNQYLQSI